MPPRKGAVVEEALRFFFLRRGFFVVRGMPVSFRGRDVTDVDLWLYGKSTGGARCVLLCDAKGKQRPKAIERILWTRGLTQYLDADGAYVATTDKREDLREIARRLGVQLLDGRDLQRIRNDKSLPYPQRLSDEEFTDHLRTVDQSLRNRTLQDARDAILGSLSEGFGTRSACRSLELFGSIASSVVSVHPGSDSARAAGRLAYLAAAVVCVSLDYVSKETAVQTPEERRKRILDVVRLGRLRDDVGQQALEMALLLISKYSPGGRNAANAVKSKLDGELERIPAEIVADQAVRLLDQGGLFALARDLEASSYRREIPTFDQMQLNARALLGALLDYSGVQRERFSRAWTKPTVNNRAGKPEAEETRQPELFAADKPSG